ncbi:MAG: glutathione S-transferase family protein [Pseudomonadota bacterium]
MDNSEPTGHYILYGSYASYYTAKNRVYLRKKGIPFLERLPSDPRFRNYIRPTSGSHRIPQLETPEGEVLQDSTVIFDALEARFPEIPALPTTPRLRFIAHLMELLGSEGLVGLAWRYRWFPEHNLHFVKMDFGRSFKPQGTDEELLHYGNLIADRMLSRGNLNHDASVFEEMAQSYGTLLDLLEAHFQQYPFMLGGHPSIADYSLMGALHAHMGRDPVPLHFMQQRAPRVFRWVEHMNTPEIQSPEFPNTPIEYAAEDQVPRTFMAVVKHILDEQGQRFVREAHLYNKHVEATQPKPGSLISDEDQPQVSSDDQAGFGAGVINIWLLQRSLSFFHRLGAEDQSLCRQMLAQIGYEDLLNVEIKLPPQRIGNRFHYHMMRES